MRRLAIVTMHLNAAKFYANQLRALFNDALVVDTYALEDRSIEKPFEADLVMISSASIFGVVKKYLNSNTEIIFANRTLSQSGIKAIQSIPKGTKALLVNVTAEVAFETISLIYQLGFKDLELHPYYPGIKNTDVLKVAITPNEKQMVPDFVEMVYNIGDRVLDMTTLMDVATILELEDHLKDPATISKMTEIIPASIGFEKMMTDTKRLECQFDVLYHYMSEGIVGINSMGQVNLLNDIASKNLSVQREETIGLQIRRIWPQLPAEEVIDKGVPITEHVVKYKGIPYVVDLYPMKLSDAQFGALCILKSFTESERRQHKLRAQVMGKGHVAKYTFDAIEGKSESIRKTIHIAERMAESQASILIYGESGTGKELFAQAIHNASNRKDGPFVAINCAALPENLLESELFGYEEGAFTGAKKGGKPGLFEMAHGGTLFLDEIGEMPLRLQARLLRVIQERKVMHLGGDYLIDVNIRILAATNRDLKQMSRSGQFRHDLYYRLNVLTLKIPPLRERKDDIPVIANEIMKTFGKELLLEHDVIEQMKAYIWEGNVRELHNCVECLCYLGKEKIEIEDLPEYIFENHPQVSTNAYSALKGSSNDPSTNDVGLILLRLLYDAYQKRKRLGRRQMHQQMLDKGYLVSENQIRKHLHELEFNNFVEIQSGRAGTVITSKGIEQINGSNGN